MLPRSQRTATRRRRSPEQPGRAPPTAPHPLGTRLSPSPALRRRGGGKTEEASPTALPRPRHSQLLQSRLVLGVSAQRGPRCVGKRLRRGQRWALLPGRRASGGAGRGRGGAAWLVCFSGCERSSWAASPGQQNAGWCVKEEVGVGTGGGLRGRQVMAAGLKLVAGHRLAVAGLGALPFRRRGKGCTHSVSWGSLPFVTWKLSRAWGCECGRMSNTKWNLLVWGLEGLAGRRKEGKGGWGFQGTGIHENVSIDVSLLVYSERISSRRP